VTTEELAGTVVVPDDEAPEEVDTSLATEDVPVVKLEDNVDEVAEDVSLEVEEIARDEEVARDEEAAEDEELADDETALEVPDAAAIWEASESWIDFKIADGIQVVSELEYPGNPRPKIRSIENS
jgi:hypothetical protein